MANETPKRPIKRATVPTVPKDKPAKLKTPAEQSEGRVKRNSLLFVLFVVVSAVVYLAIFQRPLINKYLLKSNSGEPSVAVLSDTLQSETDSTAIQEEVNTFIGQDKKNPSVYPAGTRYYLVAGTFIFYPYAEKCLNRLKAAGYDASIISTGEPRKFHRVYILSSEDASSVRTKRDELRSSQNMDVWVYAE